VVIEEDNDYIYDLSINALDFLIFYTKYNWDQRKGKIMIVFKTKDGY
jgi:hypothetical protein